MDSYAFASLAHVRILLLPVGSIQQSTFEKLATEVKTFDDIRLGDIPADQKDEKSMCGLSFSRPTDLYPFKLVSCQARCPRDTFTLVSPLSLPRIPIHPCLCFVRRISLWV
jgi:hypothetical protein